MSKSEPPFDHQLSDFKPGHRVELHPACDRWMMGDKFGTVTSVSSSRVYVKLDKSRKRFAYEPDLLRFVK